MPLHVNLRRRSFLEQTTAGVVSLACSQLQAASAQVNPNVLALLSDTDIPNAADVEARGTDMTCNLQQVVVEVTAIPNLLA